MRVQQTFNIDFHVMLHCAIYNNTTMSKLVFSRN